MSDVNTGFYKLGCGVRNCLLVLFVLLGFFASASNAADMSGQFEQRTYDTGVYRLGPGDVINISVYGEDDLSRQKYRVPDSGLIMYPFGEVRALGLTLSELEVRIADGLRGKYLVNPRVSVSMDEYRPFFINGLVERPGAYPYKSGLTVRTAVSIAGGFKERASQSNIFVQRESDVLHTQTRITLDAQVGPGDTITVEESFF